MASARFATLRTVDVLAEDTRLLSFASPPGDPLGFVGGQFIIVDSGLVAPTGKAIKRAYSLLSPDRETDGFALASKRLPDGPGSGYMHGLAPGDQIKFSGPWGKLVPAEAPAPGTRTLVLATDTGVTAALGLVRGQRFAPLLARARFLWLRTSASYFLPDDLVRALLPAGLGRVEIAPLPPPGHPERLPHVRALIGEDLGPGRVDQIFITGDGDVNYALLDHYVAAGVPATRDNVDSFFNYPKKVAA